MGAKEQKLREVAVLMNRTATRWDEMADEIERTGRVALPGEFQKVVASGISAVCKAVALLAEFG